MPSEEQQQIGQRTGRRDRLRAWIKSLGKIVVRDMTVQELTWEWNKLNPNDQADKSEIRHVLREGNYNFRPAPTGAAAQRLNKERQRMSQQPPIDVHRQNGVHSVPQPIGAVPENPPAQQRWQREPEAFFGALNNALELLKATGGDAEKAKQLIDHAHSVREIVNA